MVKAQQGETSGYALKPLSEPMPAPGPACAMIERFLVSNDPRDAIMKTKRTARRPLTAAKPAQPTPVVPASRPAPLTRKEGKRRMPKSELLPLALIASMHDLARRQNALRSSLLTATTLFEEVKSDLEKLQRRSGNHQTSVANLQANTRQKLELAAQRMTEVVQASRSQAPQICSEWLALIQRRPALMADQDGRAELERFLHTLKATDDPSIDNGLRPCPPKLLKAIRDFLHEADRLPRRCQARVESLSRRVDNTAQLASRSADASARAERAFDEAAKLEVGVRFAELRVYDCIVDLLILRSQQKAYREAKHNDMKEQT